MTDRVTAYAYPQPWRTIAGALVVVSRGGLLAIGAGILTATGPVPLVVLVRALALLVVLPAAAAELIARAFAAEVVIGDATLEIGQGGLRLEVPCAAIERIAPWVLQLPGPGFSLWLRSGRRLRYGLQADDPTPLLSALADAGEVESARAAARHPTIVYAHAKSARTSMRWYHPVIKFVAFGLLPTGVWFNAHQHIAYGGLLGQYYLEGLVPYLKTFLISWSLASIYLVLYASVWRALAEITALLTAWVAPAYASPVRRLSEIACWVMYYGGVPVLVTLPFVL